MTRTFRPRLEPLAERAVLSALLDGPRPLGADGLPLAVPAPVPAGSPAITIAVTTIVLTLDQIAPPQ